MTMENTTKSAVPPPKLARALISSLTAFAAASASFFAAAAAALVARLLLFLSIFRCASCVAAFRARFVAVFDTDVFGCTFGALICSESLVRMETPRRDFSLGAAFGVGFSWMDRCAIGELGGWISGGTACTETDLRSAVTGGRSDVIASVPETGGCGKIGAACSDGFVDSMDGF